MDKNKNYNDIENEEEDDGIVVLLDDEGNECSFEHLDTFELNGDVYVVLIPADDEDADEVVIFRVGEYDDSDEEALFPIEDQDELNAAFEEFKSRMADEFDFEE